MTLGVIFGIDQLLHDLPETPDILETAWLTTGTYTAIGTTIGGWTGVRLAMKFDK